MSSKSRNSNHSRNKQRSPSLVRPTRPVTQGSTALAEREEIIDGIPFRVVDTLSEASRATKRGSSSSNVSTKSFSLAWDETEAMGITADMRRSGPGMLSDQDRKETLYQAYLNSVWISACVDVIAKRITSGGMVIELTEKGTEDQTEYDAIHDFLHYINEDEDFLQLIRSIATDLLIYGECYMEIVRKAGVPYSLHKIDCSTMSYQLDRHGTVLKYVQNMNHSQDTVNFAPDEVIRWWLPDPKAGKKALSPIERILGSVDADAHMADWVRAFFKKGARPPFWIEFKGSKDEANRFVVWLRENYTGQANAHIPLVLYEGALLHEVGKGAVDMDFEKGRGMMKQEILAGYQVPPAAVSQIESGNIGGGTGESQDKSLQFNACDPLRQIIFEKLNYRIIKKGFKFTNYQVSTRYADFRNDADISTVDDKRIRNGSTTINEIRSGMGKQPLEGGDIAVIVTTREIQPIDRLGALSDEQTQTSQIAIGQAQAQLDMTKVQIDKAKNPPPPPPVVVPAAQPPANNVPDKSKEPPVKEPQEHYTNDLRDATLRVNEVLVRADEHLRLIREKQPQFLTAQQAREWFENALPRPTEDDRSVQSIVVNTATEQKAIDHTLHITTINDYLLKDNDSQDSAVGDPLLAAIHEEEVKDEIVPVSVDSEDLDTTGSKRFAVPIPSLEQQQANLAQWVEAGKQGLVPRVFETRCRIVWNEAETPPQTGIMIAFMLDPDTANKLAIPGGEDPHDMHCTLAYMGNIDGEPEPGKLHPVAAQDILTNTLSLFASTAQPLHGNIGGVARFTPSPSSDEMSPVIALVSILELQDWRQKLVDALSAAGFNVASNFPYTPHMTIAYIDADKPMPISTVEPLPLNFDTLCLAIGNQRMYFKLGSDDSTPEPLSPKEDQGEPDEDETMDETPATTDTITSNEHEPARGEDSDIGDEPVKQAHSRTARTEYARWRTRAVRDSRAGRNLRAFESDILDARRIHDLQVRLESTASEETIRAIFKDAIEAVDTPEPINEKKSSKSGWRPPSQAQLDLEQKLAKEIRNFIATAKISKDGVVLPDKADNGQLQGALYAALVAANHEGTAIMQGAQESIVSIAKGLADHAAEVIKDIIAQVKERVQGIIDSILGNDDIDPDEVEQEIEDQVEMWTSEYSSLVSQSEIHSAIQRATLDEMKNQSVGMVDIHNEPGACLKCKANAEGSPYPIDEAYQYLDQHPFCQCTARETNKEQ